MNTEEYKNHWENVFENKDTTKVSWYEHKPKMSLELISEFAKDASTTIIDVGAGDSKLPDCLAALGYQNLTVLDISQRSLKATKSRLGEAAESIEWVESNVLDFKSKEVIEVWHDRAVFHFITSPEDKLLYKEVILNTLAPNGILIIAAFSKHGGPLQCSGLEVSQQDEKSFLDLFHPEFELLRNFEKTHLTPSGNNQVFTWVVLKRKQQ